MSEQSRAEAMLGEALCKALGLHANSVTHLTLNLTGSGMTAIATLLPDSGELEELAEIVKHYELHPTEVEVSEEVSDV